MWIGLYQFLSSLIYFVVYSTRRLILSLALWFVLVVFSPLSIAITSLREERACLCGFCAFVCAARVGLYLFLLHLRQELTATDMKKTVKEKSRECTPWTFPFTYFHI